MAEQTLAAGAGRTAAEQEAEFAHTAAAVEPAAERIQAAGAEQAVESEQTAAESAEAAVAESAAAAAAESAAAGEWVEVEAAEQDQEPVELRPKAVRRSLG